MNKKINLAMIFLLSIISCAFTYSQQGLFDAVGYENFYNGLSIKKKMQNDRILQLIVGMYYETKKENDDKAEMDIRLAGRLRSNFVDVKKVKVEKFFEAGIIIDDTHTEDRTRTNLYISVGFIPEVFVVEKFSFEIPLGIGLVLQGESVKNAGDNSTIITTFGRGLDVNLSFHIYF